MKKDFEKNNRLVEKGEKKKTPIKGELANMSELKIGGQGRIISLSSENQALKRRLLDMGLTKNAVVTLKKSAPLGDPIDVAIRGYELAIRKFEMRNIVVEVL